MVSKSDEQIRLERLLARAEPHVARVFRQMVEELREALDITMVADLIERGDLEALDRMFEDAAQQLGVASQSVFVEAGRDSSEYIGEKLRATIAFDQTNSVAVQIMQEATIRMIREFADSQRDVVRTVISNGILQGIGPREQARNFREVVGLTTRRARTVELYRAKLEQVGNTGVQRSIQRLALRLSLRDGRGDAQIKRAIREGTPLPKERIDWLVERYRSRAIKARAETIARTEALAAVHQGHAQGFEQAIRAGRIMREEIEEQWVSAGDTRVRDSHILLNGIKQAFGQIWQGLDGPIRFPGDPDADPRERINCLTGDAIISTTGIKRVIVRHYTGEVIKISVAGGVNLTITPNHPILTQRGWVAAGDLKEGDNLVYCFFGRRSFSSKPDINHGFASAEEIARLAKVAGTVHRTSGMRVNLHGEVPDHDVDIVSIPRGLFDDGKSPLPKRLRDITLKHADITAGHLLFERLVRHHDFRPCAIAGLLVCGARERLAFVWRQFRHPDPIRLRTTPASKPEAIKAGDYHGSADPEAASNFRNRESVMIKLRHALNYVRSGLLPSRLDLSRFTFSGSGYDRFQQPKVAKAAFYKIIPTSDRLNHIGDRRPLLEQGSDLLVPGDAALEPVRLVRIERVLHDGPVYNFETKNGIIVANGIINHNCRCILVRRIKGRFRNTP